MSGKGKARDTSHLHEDRVQTAPETTHGHPSRSKIVWGDMPSSSTASTVSNTSPKVVMPPSVTSQSGQHNVASASVSRQRDDSDTSSKGFIEEANESSSQEAESSGPGPSEPGKDCWIHRKVYACSHVEDSAISSSVKCPIIEDCKCVYPPCPRLQRIKSAQMQRSPCGSETCQSVPMQAEVVREVEHWGRQIYMRCLTYKSAYRHWFNQYHKYSWSPSVEQPIDVLLQGIEHSLAQQRNVRDLINLQPDYHTPTSGYVEAYLTVWKSSRELLLRCQAEMNRADARKPYEGPPGTTSSEARKRPKLPDFDQDVKLFSRKIRQLRDISSRAKNAGRDPFDRARSSTRSRPQSKSTTPVEPLEAEPEQRLSSQVLQGSIIPLSTMRRLNIGTTGISQGQSTISQLATTDTSNIPREQDDPYDPGEGSSRWVWHQTSPIEPSYPNVRRGSPGRPSQEYIREDHRPADWVWYETPPVQSSNPHTLRERTQSIGQSQTRPVMATPHRAGQTASADYTSPGQHSQGSYVPTNPTNQQVGAPPGYSSFDAVPGGEAVAPGVEGPNLFSPNARNTNPRQGYRSEAPYVSARQAAREHGGPPGYTSFEALPGPEALAEDDTAGLPAPWENEMEDDSFFTRISVPNAEDLAVLMSQSSLPREGNPILRMSSTNIFHHHSATENRSQDWAQAASFVPSPRPIDLQNSMPQPPSMPSRQEVPMASPLNPANIRRPPATALNPGSQQLQTTSQRENPRWRNSNNWRSRSEEE